jgi:hypothetical protein
MVGFTRVGSDTVGEGGDDGLPTIDNPPYQGEGATVRWSGSLGLTRIRSGWGGGGESARGLAQSTTLARGVAASGLQGGGGATVNGAAVGTGRRRGAPPSGGGADRSVRWSVVSGAHGRVVGGQSSGRRSSHLLGSRCPSRGIGGQGVVSWYQGLSGGIEVLVRHHDLLAPNFCAERYGPLCASALAIGFASPRLLW